VKYQFDRYTLDCEQQTLAVDGKLHDVDTRVIALLGLLIKHYPAACTSDQLLKAIWPTTVVSNWSVSRLVADTRHIFDELGYATPIIQTLRGKGYRITPEFAMELAANSAVPVNMPSYRRQLFRRSFMSMVAFTLTIGLAWYALPALFQPSIHHSSESSGLQINEPAITVARILWVDDYPQNNRNERRHFEQNNIAVYTVTSTAEALMLMSMFPYDVVISDLGRGDDALAGLKLLQQMRAQQITTPFYLYTLIPSSETARYIADYGGQGMATTSLELYQQVLPHAETFQTISKTASQN